MRSVAGALVVIVTLVGAVRAEEIYRWKDAEGRLHFENVPTPGERQAPAPVAVEAAPGEEASGSDAASAPMAAPAGETAKAEDPGYSTAVSTERSRLERELRGTESRLRDIDGRLATLEQARMKNAKGSAATGGVAAPADGLSPEEETLVSEREELAQRAVEVRNDAAKLRQEVEARLGTVPAWWTDLR